MQAMASPSRFRWLCSLFRGFPQSGHFWETLFIIFQLNIPWAEHIINTKREQMFLVGGSYESALRLFTKENHFMC